MGADFTRIGRENFLQLLRCIRHKASRLERQRKIIARVCRIRLQRQRRLVAGERGGIIPQPVRDDAGVVLRLEPSRIQFNGLTIGGQGLRPFFILFRHARLRESAAGRAAVTRLRAAR